MANPVLSTKLYPPPPRPDGVERPHLLQRLTEGLQQGRRLTLVSAPAGFGKTTLVSSWVQGVDSHCQMAWVSLDGGENDPDQFLSYLIAALQQCDPEIGRTILPALKSQPRPPLPQLVQLLLERGPLSLHLVILTREDPLLPLPRLRARGQVTEVRERDLRFSEPEAGTFFHQTMRLDLAAGDVAVLAARTEGWIAGLQLAAIALQEQLDEESIQSFVSDFAGSDRFIVDYLASEVLQRQPESVREFLMCTSILMRMCGSLCDAVVFDDAQAGRSQEILDGLERANMFIVPLDSHRQWYRYHHLFADLLHHTLAAQYPGRQTALHRRASQWFEANGFLQEAVDHAFKTGDRIFAAELIERHAMRMISRSQVTALHYWCAAFPEEVIESRPGLCIFLAWSLMLTFRADIRPAVERRLEQAEACLSQPDLPSHARVGQDGALVSLHDWVIGQVCALRSQLLLAAFNDPLDPQALIALSLRSLELLPEGEKPVRAICAINLAHAHMMRSDVPNTEKSLAEALRLGLEAGNYYTAVTAIFYQARLAYILGQLRRTVEICATGLARLNPLFEHPEQEFPAIRSLYVAQALAFLEWNDLEQAGRLLEVSTDLVGWAPWVEVIGYTALVRLWEIRGNEDKAREVLDRMEKLKAAIMLAQPEGYLNIFRQGPELYRLLAEVSTAGQLRAYVHQLLASFANPTSANAAGTGPLPSSVLVEPLSQRELEILRLLSQGLSNPEIARRLFISVNTLKAHSQNIYSKLGVHNRVEAINTARKLGLI